MLAAISKQIFEMRMPVTSAIRTEMFKGLLCLPMGTGAAD